MSCFFLILDISFFLSMCLKAVLFAFGIDLKHDFSPSSGNVWKIILSKACYSQKAIHMYTYIAACISPCLLFASLINFVNNISIMLAGICFSRFSCGPPYKKLRLATCFFYYFFFLIANPQKRNPPKKKSNPIESII